MSDKKSNLGTFNEAAKSYVAVSPDGISRTFDWEGYPWADAELKTKWKHLAKQAAKEWADGNKQSAIDAQSELWGLW